MKSYSNYKDNTSWAAVNEHGFVDPLKDSIFSCLVKKWDGSENLNLCHSSINISYRFYNNRAFHSCLAGNVGIEGINFFDKLRGLNPSDCSYGGFDFTKHTAEHTTDNATEHTADDSACHTAFNTAFDTYIAEFFFSYIFRYNYRGDKFTRFDIGLGLDRSNACSFC